jgi:hypothetical protein
MSNKKLKEAVNEYIRPYMGCTNYKGKNKSYYGTEESILAEKAFLAGAEWQKKQENINPVEFVKWLDKKYKEHIVHSDYKTYVHKSDGGVQLTLEELYELWKKNQ